MAHYSLFLSIELPLNCFKERALEDKGVKSLTLSQVFFHPNARQVH